MARNNRREKKMKILCISAANMKYAADKSTSLITCQIIENIIKNKLHKDDAQVNVIKLANAVLSPCTGCGECFKTGRCGVNDDFNDIYAQIAAAEAVFIVSPHYTPIPSKLCMLLEKMEQISYLPWFHDSRHQPKVQGIPVGIIAHGGGSGERELRSYKAMVLDTIANALQTAMMEVVGLNADWPTGVVFPAKEVKRESGQTFPIQFYDWADIEGRVTPLVVKVMERTEERKKE
jgi:multimeric flavodoxin WrbA